MTRTLEESAFLPAVLASQEDVKAIHGQLTRWAPVAEALESMSAPVVLLNEQRQIVHANRAYVEFAAVPDLAACLGHRLGGSLVCVHEHKAPNGCGTGIACRNCHFANALHTALRWESGEADGQLKVFREAAHDLPMDVHLQSVIVGNHRLLFCRIGGPCGAAGDQRLAAAPPDLADLAALLQAGGPFTERFPEFDEHFVEPAAVREDGSL